MESKSNLPAVMTNSTLQVGNTLAGRQSLHKVQILSPSLSLLVPGTNATTSIMYNGGPLLFRFPTIHFLAD